MVGRIALTLAVGVAMSALSSYVARADTEYKECLSKAGPSLLAIGYCGQDLEGREEQRLQSALSKFNDVATSAVKELEAEEQSAWQVYKDVACKYYTVNIAPQEERIVGRHNCRAKLTEARADYIEEILASIEAAK
jgi:uncharacterized protein YecT (DUF1311 family)